MNGKLKPSSVIAFVGFVWLFGSSTLAIADGPQMTKTVKACAECHGPEGRAKIPGWPPISSFSYDELVAKLKAYRDGVVPESQMHEVAHQLGDDKIDEVARYYSGLNLTLEESP